MKPAFLQRSTASVIQWFNADFHATGEVGKTKDVDRINWVRSIPFIIMHLGCLGVFLVGWSWTAVTTAAALYFVRMFAITGNLSPLFFSPHFQDFAAGAVYLCPLGRVGDPARTALVGSQPSRASS